MVTAHQQRESKFFPWMSLSTGLVWLFVGLRHLDGLRAYLGLAPHPGEVLLPCLTGVLFLIAAAAGFLRRNSTGQPQSLSIIRD